MDFDDYRITPSGNAVNFGDDADTSENGDILGRDRPVDDGSDDLHGPYDLGAYEWRAEFGELFSDRFENS